MLNAALASGAWQNTYIVAMDPVSSRISITAGGTSAIPFRLLFGTGPNQENNIASTLGFERVDTGEALAQLGNGHINLASSPFVDFVMENIPNVATKRVISRQGGAMQVRHVVARVPLDCVTGSVKFYYADACDILNNYFPPTKLGQVRMKLINDRGRPYIPDGLDHSMTLEIVQLSMAFKNDILSSQQPTCKSVTLDPPTVPAIKQKGAKGQEGKWGKKVVATAAVVGVASAAYYLLKDTDDGT